MIKKLHARERAITEANRVPGSSMNAGTMIGSTIQQQSPGAQATTTMNVGELNEIICKLREALPQLNLSGPDTTELHSDIGTVELQVNSGKPKPAIIRECLFFYTRSFGEIGGKPEVVGSFADDRLVEAAEVELDIWVENAQLTDSSVVRHK